ncbi:MAG TPA: YggS family pyridoxal phosphate-dependent enzyme [Acidimicrobiia bacterium]|nr:YggS family pyridoxal phosphate-dependent enzyme [Acidimicrobiia bacterium]
MSLESVRERIDAAAARAGRRSDEITLVIVSKGQSVETIKTLHDQGERDFGENRAQELASKVDLLPPDIRWHFVGPLQSNKVRIVRPIVTLLHSLDRFELGPAWIKGPGLAPPALLQVNIGGEPQKHGVDPDDAVRIFGDLVELGVDMQGLMAIPPAAEHAEAARTHFAAMGRIATLVAASHPGRGSLSMGMTEDFEVAVEEGATFVRVGRAIFSDK